MFFEEQTKDSLINAVKKFNNMKFDKNEIRKHAENFDEEIFKKKIKDFIDSKHKEFKGTKAWEVI